MTKCSETKLCLGASRHYYLFLLAFTINQLQSMSITCSPFDHSIARVLSSFIMVNGVVLMFKTTYYYKANGEATLISFLEELRSSHSKDSAIQYRQVMHSIKMLQSAGTRLGKRHTYKASRRRYLGITSWLQSGSLFLLPGRYFCSSARLSEGNRKSTSIRNPQG